MPRINVTSDDLKRSLTLEPDWYPAEVKKYTYEQNKAKDSYNHVYDIKVIAPETVAGVVIRVWFSEKAIGTIAGFYSAITGEEVDIQQGFTMDNPEAAVSRKLDIYVKNGMYNGRPTNEISGWAPFGTQYKGR